MLTFSEMIEAALTNRLPNGAGVANDHGVAQVDVEGTLDNVLCVAANCLDSGLLSLCQRTCQSGAADLLRFLLTGGTLSTLLLGFARALSGLIGTWRSIVTNANLHTEVLVILIIILTLLFTRRSAVILSKRGSSSCNACVAFARRSRGSLVARGLALATKCRLCSLCRRNNNFRVVVRSGSTTLNSLRSGAATGLLRVLLIDF